MSLISGLSSLLISVSKVMTTGLVFVGTGIGGAAKGRVTLTPVEGRQNLDADLGLSNFSVEGAAVEKADLRLRVDDVLGTPRLEARVEELSVDERPHHE